MSLSREARGLVAAARREKSGPSDAQRKRMRRAVLVAVGTGTVAGATATSTAAAAAVVTSSSLSVVGKVGIGLFALFVAGGGAALVVDRAPTHTKAPALTAAFVTSVPAETSSNAPQVTSTIATDSAPEASSDAPIFISPPAVKPAAPSIASSAFSSANVPSDGLAEEVALLKAAQTALGAGRHSDALASLDQHAARFRKGALAFEQRALRAMALCGSGRPDEGRRISDALSSSAPGSPLAERVAAACK